MSIFSLISFGKELVSRVEAAIKKAEEFKDLTGQQKMDKVNEVAYEFFDANYDKLKINFIVKAYLKKKIRNAIPDITQKVFDLIEKQIEGITGKIKEKLNK